MKKIILTLITIFLVIFITSIFYLSLVGIETDRFNKQIKKKIIQTNKNLNIDLRKVKLTLDPLNLKFNTKIIGGTIFYSNNPLPLEYIKTEISLSSLIKNKIIFSNLEVSTRSILLKNLIGFVRAIKNSPQLFILQKITNKGQVILNLEINFDEFGKPKNDFKLNGILKDGKINILKKGIIENINFDFYVKKNNYHLKDISFKTNSINFISESININKRENNFHLETVIENKNSELNINFLKLLNIKLQNVDYENVNFSSKNKILIEIGKNFDLKNTILSSDITIDEFKYKKPNILDEYLTNINDKIVFQNHKIKLDYKNNKLSIKGNGKIQIDKTLDKIEYLIIKNKDDINLTSNLNLENIILKKQKLLNNFFPNIGNSITFKDQTLEVNYKKNILSLSGKGKVKIDKEYDSINYIISKNDNKLKYNVGLNLNQTKFEITQLNYQKRNNSNLQLKIIGNFGKDKDINLKKLSIIQKNNKIEIDNLLLGNDYVIKKINSANFNYIDTENKQNQFKIKKLTENNYKLDGVAFNANTLITNILEEKSKKENKIFENNLNLNLNINKLYIDEIYFVKNLNGKLIIKNNKLNSSNISANFKNKNKIFFTINTDSEGNKITTLTSSLAKPLVNRYKFIKGFEDSDEGYLDFYSSKKDGVSNSSLIIDNFRVKEIPALAKLLALASLQGIADLLTGEGIRFTDFEMKFTNENELMRIQELYAIGPAISLLMEGYIETDKLISLRGTLVPATTVNRSIASIPLIGDFLIGKKIGEGVFGVSFKIKGPPKNLETTVNPIKTLTPRFITRTLEKLKKN